jgi:hypothetical protein
MKNFLLIALTCLAFRVSAQFPLEHTYEVGKGFLERAFIPNVGEIYYAFNSDLKALQIYNSNHALWKTIQIPGAPEILQSATVLGIYDPYLFNSDAQLEFQLWLTGQAANGTYISQRRLMNEAGETLLIENGNIISLPNGQKKLLVTTGKVYSLPGYQLEHSYDCIKMNYFVGTGSGTPKPFYVVQNLFPSNIISVYDDNHQLVNSLEIPLETDEVLDTYEVTDDIGDGTSGFKYLVSINNWTLPKRRISIFRENGTALFSREYNPSETFALPDFYDPGYGGLLERKLNLLVSSQGQAVQQFYKLPTFELETEIADARYFDVGGRFLWCNDPANGSDSLLHLYRPDNWAVEHSIHKPLGQWWNIYHISQFVFDNDPEFEVLLCESSNGLTYGKPVLRNEDGTNLFTESTLLYGLVSRLPGLPNKLICYTSYGQAMNNGLFKVYSLPSSTPLSVIDHAVTTIDLNVTPNPSAGDVTLGFEKTPTGPVSVEIVSLQGARIATLEQGPSEKITLERALFPAPGLYFVAIRSGDWKGVAKVIIL